MKQRKPPPRIKCPVILSAMRSGGSGSRANCRFDISVINLFDEFRQPSIPYFRQPVDFAKISAVLAELDKDVDGVDNGRLRQFGKLLWNLLIPPEIRDYLGGLSNEYALQLLLVTNDISIPWEIIHDDTDFWALKYTMGRILGTDCKGARRPKRGRQGLHKQPPLLLIADPTGDLNGARREGEVLQKELSKIFSVKSMGGKVSPYDMALQIGSDEFDIIHFAGHARMGKQSGLLASGGLLESDEIARYSLARNPVVFANACATGAKGYFGANSRSIAEAFIEAGAASFIGSLWRISDDISSRFASCVYTHLKDGRTTGDALLLARRELYEKPSRDDIDWAAFTLFGSPDSRLYNPIVREDVRIVQMHVTMSNVRGTLGRILVALSKIGVNIVQGRSITFDDEKTAGYIAEVEFPARLSEDDLRGRLMKSSAGGLVISINFHY